MVERRLAVLLAHRTASFSLGTEMPNNGGVSELFFYSWV